MNLSDPASPSDATVAAAAPIVHLVGAGPGDPELLTIKAVRAIRQATVLLVDDLVGDGVLAFARRSVRIVHVGKRGGCASTPQAFIERLMVSEALRGERVVRLKGGDPFVFGRGGEEAAHLRAHGLRVEVVNGITAGLAAATSIGVPLTDRRHAQGVMFVTGHARSHSGGRSGGHPGGHLSGDSRGRSDELSGDLAGDASRGASHAHSARRPAEGPDWPTLAAAAAQGITLVIYMGIATVEALQTGLLTGLPGTTPVAVVQHASLPQQRHVICRLDALAHTVASERIGSPAVIVVGEVAGMAHVASLAATAAVAGGAGDVAVDGPVDVAVDSAVDGQDIGTGFTKTRRIRA